LGDGEALVVVPLSTGQFLAVRVFDGFPGLASLQEVGEVLLALRCGEAECRVGEVGLGNAVGMAGHWTSSIR